MKLVPCRLFALVAAFSLSGCATLFHGREQMVLVDTVTVKGAVCRGVDKEGRKYAWANTPVQAEVIKGDGPIAITCEAPGYKKTDYSLDGTVAGATFLNVVTLGLGALVDAASGASQPYPDVVKILMEPVDGAPEAAQAAYLKAKKEHEEAIRKAKADEEKQIREAAGR